jgi:general transcription factor 3C polypeptide 3 (transcription factor C subunit 4)
VHNATGLFLEQRYEEAKAVVFEILAINAETHQAWTLLAAIWDQYGETDFAIRCLMFAAHMRPRVLTAWFNCAEYALKAGSDRHDYIMHAQFAYAAAIRADSTSVEAHLGKARCYYEMNRMERALVEYKIALKLKSHQIPVLRLVAETCIDIDQVDTAIGYWKASIAHFRKFPQAGVSFSWDDADVYLELLGYGKYYDQAIRELKSVARWLQGREEETFWDDVVDNDCEWDASNSRRLGVEGFKPDRFPASSYELPLPLRVKLGLYRLHLHSTEAMVNPSPLPLLFSALLIHE